MNVGDFYRDPNERVWVLNETSPFSFKALIPVPDIDGEPVLGWFYAGDEVPKRWVRVEPTWNEVAHEYKFGDRVGNSWSEGEGRYITKGAYGSHTVLWDDGRLESGHDDYDIHPTSD